MRNSTDKAGCFLLCPDTVEGKHSLFRLSSYFFAFLALVGLYFYEFKSSPYATVFLLLSGFFLFLEHRKSSDVDLAFFKINILVGFFVFLFVLSGIYLS
jgi:hypothetical protein